MPKHQHEWETLHVVWPDPNAAEGDVGAEHDQPYRTEFCGCGEKRTVELTADEAAALGVRLGKVVSDTLTIVSEARS